MLLMEGTYSVYTHVYTHVHCVAYLLSSRYTRIIFYYIIARIKSNNILKWGFIFCLTRCIASYVISLFHDIYFIYKTEKYFTILPVYLFKSCFKITICYYSLLFISEYFAINRTFICIITQAISKYT